ncbi:cytochrome c oxidase assembly protein [Roseomonas sp. AR75]|uniref:cytochrome c oxidase assembly protein n=1 Tax=Roseomonas sp. AR75 TaxID=2562311 RepID=UPI0010BFD17F|nr:cytochrome c oxidase assembly protein [Roseomonas sp. AR75]
MGTEFWSRIYCGPAPDPSEIWLRWNLDPAVLLGLLVLACAVGRRRPGAIAVAVLAVAFVSPLCALSASLFSARVVHHILLVAAAAPLLALAWPSRAAGSLALPFVVSTVVLWAWHVPRAYDLALSFVPAYWAMQVSLLVTATAFWRAVLHPQQAGGHALLLILGGYVQMALLGALLTFAPQPLYAIHAIAPLDWGLWPLQDQQLGGLLMWVPAGLLYMGWGAAVARRAWLSAEGRPA